MRKNIIIVALLFLCTLLHAQKEASNWYFGNNAGLNFNTDTDTTTALSDGQLATDEGCTSISNTNGDLLFYTDGKTVYNANHNTMPNGTNLKGNSSSTQSAIIIPKPNNSNIYYIFTVGTIAFNSSDLGFHFYEVDMTLDNGLGDIVADSENQLLSNTSEKLSAVLKDCQSQSVWVITFANSDGTSEYNNTFFAYKVTDSGVNTTPVTSTTLGINTNEARGYLKFSPDGTKLASANLGAGLYLYDFDKSTGIVSNQQQITINLNSPSGNQQEPYGVEFSPNNNLLYVSTYYSDGQQMNNPNAQYGGLLQYNLSASDISASQIILDERQTYRSGLQLGPNGKLYRAMSTAYYTGSPFLSVVNNPDEIGLACNYQHNAVALTANSRQGLPPFITSFFYGNMDIIKNGVSTTELHLYHEETYTLTADNIPNANYTWTLDGILLAENDFDLVINSTTGSGLYEVLVESNNGECSTLRGKANVTFSQANDFSILSNIEVCDDTSNDGIESFDLTSQNEAVLETQSSSDFTVMYFKDTTRTDQITGTELTNFNNDSNPQTIYVRLQNNTTNFNIDTMSFQTIVNPTPTINTPSNIEICSTNFDNTNEIPTGLDLTSQNTIILGTQSPNNFSVHYYRDAIGANEITGLELISFVCTNTEAIFFKVRNITTQCTSEMMSFELTIYPTFTAVSPPDIETCDTSNDGSATFDLTVQDTIILEAQQTSNLTVSYYRDEERTNEITGNNLTDFSNTSNPQTIFVKISNDNSTCYSTSSFNLIASSIPDAFNANLYQCDEDGTVDGFTIFNLTEANEAITGNASNVTTQFYLTQNDAQDNINAIDGNSFNNTSNPQIIFTRVTNNNTGCSNFSELTLKTSRTKIYNYHAPEVCDEAGSEDGLNTFDLNDFSANILNGLPVTGSTISYYENTTDALLEINALISPYQNTTPYSQTLYVRVENDNACYGINEVYLTINPLPSLKNDETLFYCSNNFPSSITLDSGLEGSVSNYSFNWNTNEITETIEVETTGTYTVIATNNTTSCSKTRTIIVETSNSATIDDIKVIDGSLNNNQITILTSGNGEYEYALTDSDGDTTSFQTSNIFTQLTPGIYTVIVRDTKNNCDSVNQEISIIAFPLYFTPNADGINDTWQIYGVSSVFQPNSKITIFDRFGKLIAQIKASDRGWDGTFNGNPMPTSDYWFTAKLQDGREYRNHFTLKR